MKYGRLLRTYMHTEIVHEDGSHSLQFCRRRGMLRKSHTISFLPTEGSDWLTKAAGIQFGSGSLSSAVIDDTKHFLNHIERGRHRQQFGPTEANDAQVKALRFGFKRSHSLGTITARELPEYRARHESLAGFCDIVEERFSSGIPSLPIDVNMPPRGLVDEFEGQGVFRQPSELYTNKKMMCSNPWKETKTAERLARVARFLTNAEAPEPPPWEISFDEEVGKFGKEGQVSHARMEAFREQRMAEHAAEEAEAERLRELARVEEEQHADDEGHPHAYEDEVASHGFASEGEAEAEEAEEAAVVA